MERALTICVCLTLTVGGLDESWFYLVTVEIEAKGGPVCGCLVFCKCGVVQCVPHESSINAGLCARAWRRKMWQ